MTYYDILGVRRNATQDEIHEALVTQLVKLGVENMQNLNNFNQHEKSRLLIVEAYETLSNPQKRRNYDFVIQKSVSNFLIANFGKSCIMGFFFLAFLGSIIDYSKDLDKNLSLLTIIISGIILIMGYTHLKRKYYDEY